MLAVFLFALSWRALNLWAHWPLLPDWNIDASGYQQLAINLMQTGVFSLNSAPPFQPDAIRTPAYPLLMAFIYRVVGVNPQWVLVAQAILDALTATLSMGIAANLTKSKRLVIAVGVIYALYPTAWRYCAELYVEIVLAFVVALIFWRATHLEKTDTAPGWLGCELGVLSGLAVLLKPAVIFLVFGMSGFLLGKRQFRQVFFYVIAVGIVLTPWVLRNQLVFGRPMLSTAFENNLARVSAPATLAAARGQEVAPWTPQWEALFLEIVAMAAQKNPPLFATPVNTLSPQQINETQRLLATTAQEILAAYPLAFVTSHAQGAVRGLLPQEYRYWFQQMSGQTWESQMPAGIAAALLNGDNLPLLALTLFGVFGAVYALGYLLAFIGVWRLQHTHRLSAALMASFILYMVALPGPIAYERFYIPVMPLMIVLIGLAFHKATKSP